MKRYGVLALLAVGAVLFLCSDGGASWRRRRCPPCIPYCSPCVPYPCGTVIRPYDKRLETDKRNIPEYTEAVTPDFFAPLGFARRAWREPDADTFTVRRHHRGRAKTTFAVARVEPFADLRALILSLPDDDEMTALTRRNWDFDRIDKEQRNVRVTAYLFAIAKEADNDYHLIIDDDGSLEEGAKLNVEISGIPNEGPDVEALRQVRNRFKAYFDGRPPRKYEPFRDPPVRVVIEGSLFFDRDHPPGEVGPQGYRPATAWEIHPVRSIRFLQN